MIDITPHAVSEFHNVCYCDSCHGHADNGLAEQFLKYTTPHHVPCYAHLIEQIGHCRYFCAHSQSTTFTSDNNTGSSGAH
jgi:hypothetical protein